MSADLTLIAPSGKYKVSFNRVLSDYRKAGDQRYSLFFTSGEPDLNLYIAKSNDLRAGKPSLPPTSTFWLTNGQDILVVARIRHRLDGRAEKVGGHIGVDVPHMHWKKGYGTVLLRLALGKARLIFPRISCSYMSGLLCPRV